LRLKLAASVTTLTKPGWLELANDAFYLIGSAVFQCIEDHCATKVKQKTLFFVFQSVSRANMASKVNKDTSPLTEMWKEET
jgi:hypothetical protein